MKYSAKFVVVYEYQLEAADTVAAAREAEAVMKKLTPGTRLLGVVRSDIGWPDTTATERPAPPKGRPPSGTPGTPTAPIEDQPPIQAIAVAA